MKGLILAAGIGKRLMPLTRETPKALISLAGRPLISYLLLKYKGAKIVDIGIVINPQDYPKFKSSLRDFKLNIEFIFQKSPQGTAKAVQLARDFIGNRRFLLSWCDFISPFGFKKIIKAHLCHRSSATLLINKDPSPTGTAQVIYRGPYITKIVEKPKRNFSAYGSTGVMVLEPEVFLVLGRVKPGAEGEYHIADALQYLIKQGKKIRYVKLDIWRVNVNTLRDLKAAGALIAGSVNPAGL